MGMVLAFDPVARQARSPRETGGTVENAEIIIFPGVRIERHVGYRVSDGDIETIAVRVPAE